MPNLTDDEKKSDEICNLCGHNIYGNKCVCFGNDYNNKISALKKQIEELKKEILILRNENLEEGNACR